MEGSCQLTAAFPEPFGHPSTHYSSHGDFLSLSFWIWQPNFLLQNSTPISQSEIVHLVLPRRLHSLNYWRLSTIPYSRMQLSRRSILIGDCLDLIFLRSLALVFGIPFLLWPCFCLLEWLHLRQWYFYLVQLLLKIGVWMTRLISYSILDLSSRSSWKLAGAACQPWVWNTVFLWENLFQGRCLPAFYYAGSSIQLGFDKVLFSDIS